LLSKLGPGPVVTPSSGALTPAAARALGRATDGRSSSAARSRSEAGSPHTLDEYSELVAKAALYARHGLSRASQRLYLRALELDPHGSDALAGAAAGQLDRRRYAQAETLFVEALRYAPEDGPALVGLAETFRLRGERARSLDGYRRYLQLYPDGPKAAAARRHVRQLQAALAD
jgi:tetratricopeptide (TPR) repeat protein